MKKTTFSKKELKEIIEEVIQERWSDVFKTKKKVTKDDLFTDFQKWLENVLDPAGRYAGPNVSGYLKGEFITNIEPPFDRNSIEAMETWNKEFGLQNGVSFRDIMSINKLARDRFYEDYPEAILGSFPN